MQYEEDYRSHQKQLYLPYLLCNDGKDKAVQPSLSIRTAVYIQEYE